MVTQRMNNTSGFQAIVENSKDGFLIVDKKSMIRFVNPAASIFLNKKPDALLDTPFPHPIKRDDAIEMNLIRNNGEPGTGEIQVVDIFWENAEAYLITIRDITERVIYDRLKDEFVSNVSHELRTPLTSMRESISQVYDGILGDVNENQQKYLSICIKNIDRLRKIVNELLDISKMEAGKIQLQKCKDDLVEIVRSSSEVFMPVLKKRELDFEISVPEKVFHVFVDRDRIVQVMNNLLGNATKFTLKGKIQVAMTKENGSYSCSVSDTGEGISKEELPLIFDKFKEFEKSTRPGETGSGLGLAISKKIVELHRGTIKADSETGKGSIFTFALPQYSSSLVVQDFIDERLKESNENFMLYHVHINDLDSIIPLVKKSEIQEAGRKIESRLKNLGKQVCPVFVEPDEIVAFAEDYPENKTQFKTKLFRIIKEIYFDVADAEIDFSYGKVMYPSDGQISENLWEKCSEQKISETRERMEKYILVVDDIVELTEQVQILLEHFGYQHVDVANSGQGVFDYIQNQNRVPDLLILDMKMPGMSGYEVIGRLKESYKTKDMPVLIMSGYEVEMGRLFDYISHRAILTINKPVQPELLRKMVYFLI
ncbi:response regulator [bacterium]|nr:response regulator [bacterium]